MDGTSGVNGAYANIAATGGTTAFSTSNLTASLTVSAPAGFNKKIFFSTWNDAIYSP